MKFKIISLTKENHFFLAGFRTPCSFVRLSLVRNEEKEVGQAIKYKENVFSSSLYYFY